MFIYKFYNYFENRGVKIQVISKFNKEWNTILFLLHVTFVLTIIKKQVVLM